MKEEKKIYKVPFTLSVTTDLLEEIDSQIVIGETRSSWIRDAIKAKLRIEKVIREVKK